MASLQRPTMSNATASHFLEDVNKHAAAWQDGDQRARQAAVSSCYKLIQELETPSEALVRMLWCGPAHLAVLRIAVEIGVFQHLTDEDGSAKSSDEVAQATSCDPILMKRILRNLAAIGFVREAGADSFAATSTSKSFNESIFQESVKFMIDVCGPGNVSTLKYLKENNYQNPVNPGDTPMQLAYDCRGKHTFQLFAEMGAMQGFGDLMKVWNKGRSYWADEKAGFYPFSERLVSGARTGSDQTFLVDIGGAQGHDFLKLLALHPQEKMPGQLVLQDLPEAVELIAPNALPASIQVMAYDAFTPQPIKGARTYFMHSILHDWPNDKAKEMLVNVAAAMEKGYSKLLVWDQVMPDKGCDPLFAALDWEVMVFLAASERSEGQWKSLIEDPDVGLKITGVWYYSQYDQSIIEAELA